MQAASIASLTGESLMLGDKAVTKQAPRQVLWVEPRDLYFVLYCGNGKETGSLWELRSHFVEVGFVTKTLSIER